MDENAVTNTGTVSENIFAMVKRFLQISHQLSESDRQELEDKIASGMDYLHEVADPDATFAPGTFSGQLLCEYVLRTESGATDTFGTDFGRDLIQQNMSYRTAKYAEAKGYSDASSGS